MNGANALLSASTSSSPKTTTMVSRGSSQNFFRTRRNFQNSAKNVIFFPSELVGHVGPFIVGGPKNPICLGFRIARQPQGVLAQHLENHCARGEHQVEQQPGNNGV